MNATNKQNVKSPFLSLSLLLWYTVQSYEAKLFSCVHFLKQKRIISSFCVYNFKIYYFSEKSTQILKIGKSRYCAKMGKFGKFSPNPIDRPENFMWDSSHSGEFKAQNPAISEINSKNSNDLNHLWNKFKFFNTHQLSSGTVDFAHLGVQFTPGCKINLGVHFQDPISATPSGSSPPFNSEVFFKRFLHLCYPTRSDRSAGARFPNLAV